MEKNQMSKHIHALGMKLQERVSSKVVYKVILVTHLEAIVQVKNEVSNSWTFSLLRTQEFQCERECWRDGRVNSLCAL